jgi:hypothetical protein
MQSDSLDWFCLNTVLHRRKQEKYFCRMAENYRQRMQRLTENIIIYVIKKSLVFIEKDLMAIF